MQKEDLRKEMLAILNELIDGPLDWELEAVNGNEQDVTAMWDRIQLARTKANIREMRSMLLEIMNGKLGWQIYTTRRDLSYVYIFHSQIEKTLEKAKGKRK